MLMMRGIVLPLSAAVGRPEAEAASPASEKSPDELYGDSTDRGRISQKCEGRAMAVMGPMREASKSMQGNVCRVKRKRSGLQIRRWVLAWCENSIKSVVWIYRGIDPTISGRWEQEQGCSWDRDVEIQSITMSVGLFLLFSVAMCCAPGPTKSRPLMMPV